MQNLIKVTEAAKIIGIAPEYLRDLCHARGQKFAVKLKPRGHWHIDIDKLRAFVDNRQEATRREETRYEETRYTSRYTSPKRRYA